MHFVTGCGELECSDNVLGALVEVGTPEQESMTMYVTGVQIDANGAAHFVGQRVEAGL